MSDLTRWNRAGLSRFRYIDGNAVEYLEFLRQQLVAQYADPDTGLCDWINPPEPQPVNEIERDGESLFEREERLSLRQMRMLETYRQDRRDWAWEITRSFARCCHILTEYSDAYANEGFLGTATQWEHVRRLVEMLDYHPAPPASASAWLSFIAKEGKSGRVAKGFQVKNSPPAGADKVIFETLDDLEIDYRLNALKPKGWDENSDPATPDDDSGTPAEREFSPLANEAVIYLQGVGETWGAELDAITAPDSFRIRDFLDIDPNNAPGLSMGKVRLRELKAKATVIGYFELESGWADIVEWLLKDIAAASTETLSETTGKNLEQVKELQLTVELIAAYLDQPFFNKTRLKNLLAPAVAVEIPDSLSTYWIAPDKPKIEAGQVALVYHDGDDLAEAASIAQVAETTATIDLLPSPVQTNWSSWPLSEILLQVSPRWQRDCWLNGDNVIRTTEAHGLAAEAYISWMLEGVWFFAQVIEADKRGLRIDFDGTMPEPGTLLYESYPLESEVMATTMEAIGLAGGGQPNVEDFVFPDAQEPVFTMKQPPIDSTELPPLMPPGGLDFGSFLFPTPLLPMDLVKAAVELMLSMGVMVIPSTGDVVFKSMPEPPDVNDLFDLLDGKVTWRDDLLNETMRKEALADMLEAPVDEPILLFQKILDNLEQSGPLIAVRKNPEIKATVDETFPLFLFDSSPEKIEPGDWVAGRFTDGLRALKVRAVDAYAEDESFSLSFSNLVGNEGELEKVYADFRAELEPQNASISNEPIDGDELELEDVPDSLQVGQDVLLTAEGKDAVASKVERIDGNIVVFDPPASGFSKGELVISGNVVLAGHGESKPQKILGSGDAAKSSQSFIFDVEDLSFVADATKDSGVAAAIDVSVDGRIWEQVSSLKDSVADDHHYVVRMTEEGTIKIHFGDGKYGRRLPTGKNNIRVAYRVGSGISGNVAAGSLEKPVNPHPLVDSLLQRTSASGGGDMEDSASLRDNAPPTLLALKRAVSLTDFSHLAAAQSSIWQATAYNEVLHGGRLEKVRVVIVPAGGVTSADINDDLKSYLQQHALPGLSICVDDFEAQLFDITVTARIETAAFKPAQVQSDIEDALTEYFKLKNRKLGAHLYLSEVYKIVEAVQGVENSICLLNDEESLKVISVTNRSAVVYLDTAAGSTLAVSTEAHQP